MGKLGSQKKDAKKSIMWGARVDLANAQRLKTWIGAQKAGIVRSSEDTCRTKMPNHNIIRNGVSVSFAV